MRAAIAEVTAGVVYNVGSGVKTTIGEAVKYRAARVRYRRRAAVGLVSGAELGHERVGG